MTNHDNAVEHSGTTVSDTARQCLHIVASAMGVQPAEGTIASTNELMLRLRQSKLKVKLKQPSREEMADLPIPTIAVLKDGNYVVLGRQQGDSIIVLDPLRGKPVNVPLDYFEHQWNGTVLITTKPLTVENLMKRFNLNWFIPVIMKFKHLIAETLAASFFLQLFALIVPLFTQVIVDKVIVHNGIATLDVLAIVILVSAVLQAVMSILRTYLLTHTTNKIDVVLGTKLFRHLAALPLQYFENRRVGDTLMRVSAMNSIREFLTGSSLKMGLDMFFAVVFIAVMYYYSPPLTLIALLAVPLFLIQNIISTPIYYRRLNEVWSAGAENNAFLVEAVTGIHTVKSLALEPQFNHRFEHLLAKYVRTTFNSAMFNVFLGSSSNTIQRLSSLSILWFGGTMVIEGQMTLGQLIAFQMLAGQVSAPLMGLAGMWQSVQQAGLSMERIGDIIGTRPEPSQQSVSGQLPPLHGKIVFDDVSFRYRADTDNVLNKINITIEPGMQVGIVGRSGSGKSTLTKLVQSLYFPEAGKITIDGIDISQIPPAWLRRQIGVVLQENYLFSGSVRENIAMAKPSAPMEEVIKAAIIAGAHDFILELPEGYDTKVGERGTSLSGGQRQRIAIARALMTDPRILIFDEATSALDYESEQVIMDNLDQICSGRTMLMIAHRLSTVKNCNIIIVIEEGQVIEQGTHEQLYALKGMYYKLYKQQEG